VTTQSHLFDSVLITGVSGLVGAALYEAVASRARNVTGVYLGTPFSTAEKGRFVAADLSRPEELRRIMNGAVPTLVFNCAAMPDIAPCETDPRAARRINADAPALLADVCHEFQARLVHFSTDQVFDGADGMYGETAPVSPVHEYGRTKAGGERAVLDTGADAAVIRLALVYGRSHTGGRSASEKLVRALRAGRTVSLFDNEYRTPVLVDDAARAAVCIAESGHAGIVHVAGPDRVTRHDFGREVAARFGLPADLVQPARSPGLQAAPPRPLDLSLDTGLATSLLPFRLKGLREGLSHCR
jgi:dTDP-4-dehydrorhamnose reductase